MPSVKLNATMQSEMVARIDVYCAAAGMTRSSFLAMASTQYLDAIEKKPIVTDAFSNMADLFKLVLSGKTGTDEYSDKLASLERAAEVIKK